MEENLIEIYSADQQYKINIVQEILAENKIDSVTLDQKGSALGIGEIKLFVDKEDEKKARAIIATHNL
ncbi:MAG: hypothetical protein Kow00127_19160 [Bacteroidales bacterium]